MIEHAPGLAGISVDTYPPNEASEVMRQAIEFYYQHSEPPEAARQQGGEDSVAAFFSTLTNPHDEPAARLHVCRVRQQAGAAPSIAGVAFAQLTRTSTVIARRGLAPLTPDTRCISPYAITRQEAAAQYARPMLVLFLSTLAIREGLGIQIFTMDHQLSDIIVAAGYRETIRTPVSLSFRIAQQAISRLPDSFPELPQA